MRCSHHSEGYMAARGAKRGWNGDEGSLYQRNLRKVNEVACKRGEGGGGGKGLAMKTVIDI